MVVGRGGLHGSKDVLRKLVDVHDEVSVATTRCGAERTGSVDVEEIARLRGSMQGAVAVEKGVPLALAFDAGPAENGVLGWRNSNEARDIVEVAMTKTLVHENEFVRVRVRSGRISEVVARARSNRCRPLNLGVVHCQGSRFRSRSRPKSRRKEKSGPAVDASARRLHLLNGSAVRWQAVPAFVGSQRAAKFGLALCLNPGLSPGIASRVDHVGDGGGGYVGLSCKRAKQVRGPRGGAWAPRRSGSQQLSSSRLEQSRPRRRWRRRRYRTEGGQKKGEQGMQRMPYPS